MSAADTIRASLTAEYADHAPGSLARHEIERGLAALDELEAELARVEKDLYYQRLMHQADLDFRRETLEPRLKELEAELERLTVGRATLEDQTNRAELAEARADIFETALREIAALGDVDSDTAPSIAARALLSGGSE